MTLASQARTTLLRWISLILQERASSQLCGGKDKRIFRILPHHAVTSSIWVLFPSLHPCTALYYFTFHIPHSTFHHFHGSTYLSLDVTTGRRKQIRGSLHDQYVQTHTCTYNARLRLYSPLSSCWCKNILDIVSFQSISHHAPRRAVLRVGTPLSKRLRHIVVHFFGGCSRLRVNAPKGPKLIVCITSNWTTSEGIVLSPSLPPIASSSFCPSIADSPSPLRTPSCSSTASRTPLRSRRSSRGSRRSRNRGLISR